MKIHNILITGAGGYIGRQLVSNLANHGNHVGQIVAMDIQPMPIEDRLLNVEYVIEDIRSPLLTEILESWNIDTVIHLAAIVNPGKHSNRKYEYSVDVLGTKNLLDACLAKEVKRFIITSSGACLLYTSDAADE